MREAFRAIAYAAWLLAFGLSIWLAIELHEYKFGIALGVAILALILSAFGLVMARHCAQQKDRLAMTIGVVLWAAGALTFSITEFGFWYSSYKERYAEYVQVTKSKVREEGLKDSAWEAIRTGEARASSAELEAKMKAARQNDAWLSSKGCVNATQPKSRAFCQGYFELEAKLASAGKLEALEARVIGEKVETKESVVHNVFAAADLLADNSDLSGRQAATVVVVIIAMMLMLSRDLLLILANPFGRREDRATAAKDERATPVAPSVSFAAQPAVVRTELPSRPDLSRKPVAETPQNPPKPDDTPPPGDAKPIAEKPGNGTGGGGFTEEVSLVPSKPVLVTDDWKPAPKLSKKDQKRLEKERLKNDAIKAVEEFAAAMLDVQSKRAKFVRTQKGFVESGGLPGDAVRKAFRKWAQGNKRWRHLATFHDNPLGKAMAAVLETGRPTNGGGAVYAALLRKEAAAVAA